MPEATDKLIAQFSDIQTLPHVVTHLSSLMADPDSTIKQFEDVIKMDPILVVRLLKLVNSPFYGLVQQVDSISRAVAYLGMKNIHNIAITEALKTYFQKKVTPQSSRARNCGSIALPCPSAPRWSPNVSLE